MTAPADLVLTNGEVHTLGDPDETYEAVAVRDGRIVRLADSDEIDFLVGVETEVVDLAGRVCLPGFTDAHTHMTTLGRSLVHADLSTADSPGDAIELLRDRAAEVAEDEWVLGFGYDESTWDESRYLTRNDLDAVTGAQPVAAVREDMHVASLNSVALDRLLDEMPDDDVHRDAEGPTGVVVEEAVDPLYAAIEPGPTETRDLLESAQAYANERGVVGVHDMVRQSHAPGVYRDLAADGDLSLRVRLNYWSDHLDALLDLRERTNHGSEFVRVGAVKSYTDGSFGGRTAKLSEPYADAEEGEEDGDAEDGGTATGSWVVAPDELQALVTRADDAGLQFTAHAIGDEAVDAVLDAYETCDDPGAARHRVEHAELTSDEAIERFADSGVIASVQPNFLKWAGEGGLYESRLGDRRTETNRYADLLAAGVHLAFGSDCMPLDPLLGVHHAVNAPAAAQRLGVTEALRAYTRGAAYAGFDEDRLGTVEVGKLADLVVLDDSPWEQSDAIRDIDVALTLVDGDVVYDGR
ncbi:amidohydrolase [Salinirubrum litoreum]|uniref:Amidohydrolase n=1 Tax=Salinirubrum litoreum TaxID=1126234 RepID=A0ABD5RDD3_9EURY|nr:amidohydrolase [Salinirubrum litoreum]